MTFHPTIRRCDMREKTGNLVSFFVALVLLLPASASVAWATYPDRPITLINTATPGSGSDLSARALADSAGKMLGQPIMVVNTAGGGGLLALSALSLAKPDGYTIGASSNSSLGMHPHTVDLPYDNLKAFDHIMGYGRWDYGPCVKGDSPFKTLKDLVTYARANPGKIKYGTSASSSPNNQLMVYLAKTERIKWEEVVFKGVVEAATAVMGGHIDVVASTDSIATPYVQAGRLRLLASASESRWKWVPDVPTFKELGYNYQISVVNGLSAPKGVPKPILDKLREVLKKAMDDPEFSKIMDKIYYPIKYRSGDEYKAIIEDTYKQHGAMLMELGIHKSQKK
jgi:tripartite-type tricarboxylate transporter receptor subunit TctC